MCKFGICYDFCKSLFHSACAMKKRNIVLKMIGNGFDVNAKTGKHQLTSLHVAVMKQNHEIAKILLDQGADVNRVTGDSETPLFLAVEKNNSNVTSA